GYFSFHPDSLYENREPPPVVITRFLVRNKEMNPDSSILFKKQIRLDYDQNFFSFEFATLDYFDPQKNEYAYMLEGLDDNWTYSGNQRIARYTKVPPGSYVFRVKGSNNDGYWNEAGASIAITILPPPWKTWWAYTIYGIFFIGLIVAWRRYDLKRQRLKQDLEIEHVEAEKLKELDTMKSRFFANISHEFRTPLTLILGPLHRVFSKTSDEETKQDLNIMQRNARRLQTLINQLLSLSKLESGKMKLLAKEENIVALVNGYIQSFESLAKQKKIDLTFNSTEENIQLFVDKDKIEKILYNLLSNAFKFTGAGGRIEVEITPLPPSRGDTLPTTFSPFEGGQRGVKISISDTGRSIPQEKLEHIFDRFYQADDSFSKDQEGTGIGLALTKELVELHHGSITVESHEGKGTKFTIYFPLGSEHLKPEEIVDSIEPDEMIEPAEHIIQFTESNSQELTTDDDGEKDTKPLLLIVEDNDDLRSYIRSYLIKDYQISEASDGEMGFEKSIEKIPDLVVSDVMMPKMDGFELCKKLKTDERTSHIPVILLTARAGKESKMEGLEIGADDFITKPFDVDELLIRIKNLIKQRNELQDQFLKNAEKIGLSQLMGLPASGITSMDQKFLKRAVDTVEEHLDDFEFSVDQFTNEMAVSQMQLYRKLKALVNFSANEFIRSIRLSHAAQLIKKKSDNIAQISYAVGFNNPSYFAECFKKQFGVSPSEYS
ncbi:MAG: response regulator, partial [Bacteroidales bacterium]|nr:response regulator [Bacteroidales bacterium]